MKRYLLPICMLISFWPVNAQTISDIDGNIYNVLSIGAQVWLKENLKTTRQNDGTSISSIKDANTWMTQSTPAYCWYNNDSVAYKDIYGALYNWYAVSLDKLCPKNWHVPTDGDWLTLVNFLGGKDFAGNKMKEAGLEHWYLNTEADNSSGFTALPGGFRTSYNGLFYYINSYGAWWSTTAFNANYRTSWNLYNNEIFIGQGYTDKGNGHYVRCLKYNATNNTTVTSNDVIIFPNPALDKFFIKAYEALDGHVIIYDLRGVKLIDTNFTSNPIDISKLSKGIYVVKIIDSEKTVIRSLIKE